MLDINFIRNNPDKVKQAIDHKHENASNVDQILELDTQLGYCHHSVDRPDQAVVFSAVCGKLSLYGKDARGCAEAGKDKTAMRQRPGKAEPRHDGAV